MYIDRVEDSICLMVFRPGETKGQVFRKLPDDEDPNIALDLFRRPLIDQDMEKLE